MERNYSEYLAHLPEDVLVALDALLQDGWNLEAQREYLDILPPDYASSTYHWQRITALTKQGKKFYFAGQGYFSDKLNHLLQEGQLTGENFTRILIESTMAAKK